MKCKKCGAENPDDGSFCEKCGAALAAAAKGKKRTAKTAKPKKASSRPARKPSEVVDEMVKTLPIANMLYYGGLASLAIGVLAGILWAADAFEAFYFFRYLLEGMLVGGILTGLLMLVVASDNAGAAIMGIRIKDILIYGAGAAVLVGLLAGILYAADSFEAGGFFEWTLRGILASGILIGLSVLAARKPAG